MAEEDLTNLERAQSERAEIATEARDGRGQVRKTVFTPNLKGERDEDVVTVEERERRVDDKRAQFFRACQLSLVINKWLETRTEAHI